MKDSELSEVVTDPDGQLEPDDNLQTRLEKLEHESREHHRLTEKRVILAELKVEALRANMIDLDGLQFVDLSQLQLSEDGGLDDAAAVIGRLKRAKPWLFATPSSSSIAKVPPSGPVRQKLAKDMSEEEYRVARANIIRRSVL